MSASEEIVIDPATGLPELPEGLFWRVGDFARSYASGGWSRGSGGLLPGIGIMRWEYVKKAVTTPIYGTRWYNKKTVVEYDIDYTTEKEAQTVRAALFTGHTAYSKTEIPSIGYETGSMSMHGKTTEWNYEIPVTREGTLWLAEKLLKAYTASELYWKKYNEGEEAKKKMRDEIYGDYPPKTIL